LGCSHDDEGDVKATLTLQNVFAKSCIKSATLFNLPFLRFGQISLKFKPICLQALQLPPNSEITHSLFVKQPESDRHHFLAPYKFADINDNLLPLPRPASDIFLPNHIVVNQQLLEVVA
jgi:hypothetical protein